MHRTIKYGVGFKNYRLQITQHIKLLFNSKQYFLGLQKLILYLQFSQCATLTYA